MTALKPCPFPICGNLNPSVRFDVESMYGYHVECPECRCFGPWSAEESEAITAWNTRATDNEPGAASIVSKLLEQLAVVMADKFYPEVTQWESLSGDAIGLITQIDNMVAGLVRTPYIPSARDKHINGLKFKIEQREQRIKELEKMVIEDRMRTPPCVICRYNGPGYFQPATHPCAKIWHARNLPPPPKGTR